MPVYAILILLIFIFLIILFLCALLTYRKFLKENLLPAPASSRLENLNQFLLPTGFQYNSANDYFYAAMDCWQRSCGYCRLYDESAASFSMVIDSEPIYFDYGGRRWLIEFWKGQYGMTAGAEVGIYATDKKDLHIPGVFDGPFFEAVSDEELLPIRLCLYEEDTLLAKRRGVHWWLTVFLLGKYCPPDILSARISITFPDSEMCRAFLDGLKNAGYGDTEIQQRHLTVTVLFTTPKTVQPAIRQSIVSDFLLYHNQIYCREYQRITQDYTDTLSKLEYLSEQNPLLYHTALHFTASGRLRDGYHLLMEALEN